MPDLTPRFGIAVLFAFERRHDASTEVLRPCAHAHADHQRCARVGLGKDECVRRRLPFSLFPSLSLSPSLHPPPLPVLSSPGSLSLCRTSHHDDTYGQKGAHAL